jgi:hypothetical protein
MNVFIFIYRLYWVYDGGGVREGGDNNTGPIDAGCIDWALGTFFFSCFINNTNY